uniref:Uncharacterized protein n=1 Tax=Candidatus Kentrum sp. TUN TaxID=2126343 RepID=A0A451A997_9GAMM|nr:MAG: hypothetical protein BECKTUN1418F_GA0071002_10855 [Candidatus Kentron sp. TUN]VFK62600.1 MAG: hypothetical protein BECKTUN1418E_GA0071001_10835 [Candidatus Kentron sp. TUN]
MKRGPIQQAQGLNFGHFRNQFLELVETLTTHGKWKKKLSNKFFIYSVNRGKSPTILREPDGFAPRWQNESFRSSIRDRIRLGNSDVPYEHIVRFASETLDGYSFSEDPSTLRGVVLYVLGAPTTPIFDAQRELGPLEEQLREKQIKLLVAQFTANSEGKRLNFTKDKSIFRYLQLYELDIEHEFNNGHKFADAMQFIQDKLELVLLPVPVFAGNVFFPGGRAPDTSLSADDGSLLYLVVTVKDPVLLQRPDGEELSIPPTKRPHFMDPLLAYEKTEDEEHYLVHNEEDDQWGWISSDYVLTRNEPLRDENDEERDDNPAFIKVIAKSNWRTQGGRNMEHAPILNGPGKDFDKIGQINICQIRYAFDIREGDDGKAYILVGNDPQLDPMAASNNLQGWIQRDYTILWESRAAVWYNKANRHRRKRGVPIFRTQRDLRNFMGNSKGNDPIAIENFKSSEEIAYDTTRFPILDEDGDEINIAFVDDTICEEGWVSKEDKAGNQQLVPWILIERISIDEMIGIVAQLYNLAKQRNPRGLGKSVIEITKRASGDPIRDGEKIAEYLARRYHIPFRDISMVLQHTPNQLEEKFRSNTRFRGKFVKTIGKKYRLLQSVAEERTGKLVWNQKNRTWEKKKPITTKKWWWKTKAGNSWA